MSKTIEKLKFILEKIDDLLYYKTQYSTIEELLNNIIILETL